MFCVRIGAFASGRAIGGEQDLGTPVEMARRRVRIHRAIGKWLRPLFGALKPRPTICRCIDDHRIRYTLHEPRITTHEPRKLFGKLHLCPVSLPILTCMPQPQHVDRGFLDFVAHLISARDRQRLGSAEAIGPGLHGLVVDDLPGVHIGQGLAGQTVTFLFLIDPGR